MQRGGSGAPLVLLHGYMMSGWYFRNLVPALERTHEVITIDLPGFGESDRPAPSVFGYDAAAFAGVVDEVLARLGVPRAAVLGHSMGGGVALAVAARSPERVERLVLVSPAVYTLPVPALARLVMTPVVGPLLWKHAFTRGELKRQMRTQHFRDARAITDELVDHVWSRFRRAGGPEAAYAVARWLSSLQSSTGEPMRVRAPTLLVWGDEDRMVPLEHARRLQGAIAGARLAIVPACGHNVHLERGDELLRQLQPFLAERALRPVEETPVERARAMGAKP